MEINNKFDIGGTVFLKTDPDQFPRMVVGIVVRKETLVYQCQFGMGSSDHYDFEMSKERDTMIACGIEVKSADDGN